MLKERGPGDFENKATAKGPLSLVVLDGTGPFYIKKEEIKFNIVHIMVGVELITYRTHLISVKCRDTVIFDKALEILQSRRARLILRVIDDPATHEV